MSKKVIAVAEGYACLTKKDNNMRSLIAIILLAASCAVAIEFPLIENNQAVSAIVLPPKFDSGEAFAALELAAYLEKITGARPEIRADAKPGIYNIFIGTSGKFHNKVTDQKIQLVKDDGFLIAAMPEGLYVTGNRARAVIFGVYELLKRYGDVRWIHPTAEGEYVPRKASFAVPEQITVINPSFRRRNFNLVCANINTMSETELWELRNNMISAYCDGPKRAGGHVFSALLSDTYFPEHPEYYGLYKGVRLPQCGKIKANPSEYGKGGMANQPCTSNPETIRIMCQNLVLMAAKGGADVFTILNNDSTAWCECDNCRKLDPPEEKERGLVSTRYWTLVNQLVEAGKKELPQVEFNVSAYQTFQEPPLGIKPDSRVSIDFCLHHRCYTHSMGDLGCAINKRFRDINLKWLAFKLPVATYEYTDCLPVGTVAYLPLEGVVARDLKYYKKIGNDGYCDETPPMDGVYNKSYSRIWTENWRANFLVRYVQAYFMWNVDADLDQVLDDVGSKFYGKAWPEMKAYRALLRQAYEENNGHFMYGTPRHALGGCLQKPGISARLNALLDSAAAKAAGDIILAGRVKQEKEFFSLSWEEQSEIFKKQQLGSVVAVRCTAPIVVDGKFDEYDWGKAAKTTDFRRFLKKDVAPDAASIVRALYDDDNLYLSVEGMEPWPDQMVTEVAVNDGPVWQDNNFELFVAPPALSPRYVHWVVNAAGYVYDTMTYSPQDSDLKFNLNAEFKTVIEKDRWVVEIRIPFAQLGGKPKAGEIWKINVARGRNLKDDKGSELSSWSNGAVHGVEGYREIIFR